MSWPVSITERKHCSSWMAMANVYRWVPLGYVCLKKTTVTWVRLRPADGANWLFFSIHRPWGLEVKVCPLEMVSCEVDVPSSCRWCPSTRWTRLLRAQLPTLPCQFCSGFCSAWSNAIRRQPSGCRILTAARRLYTAVATWVYIIIIIIYLPRLSINKDIAAQGHSRSFVLQSIHRPTRGSVSP